MRLEILQGSSWLVLWENLGLANIPSRAYFFEVHQVSPVENLVLANIPSLVPSGHHNLPKVRELLLVQGLGHRVGCL